MEPGSNSSGAIVDKSKIVRKNSIIFGSIVVLLVVVVFIIFVVLNYFKIVNFNPSLFFTSLSQQKFATKNVPNISNTTLTNKPSTIIIPTKVVGRLAPPTPTPTPIYDKDKARGIISSYVTSKLQQKYLSTDYSKLDPIFSKNYVALQWGIGPNQTRVYSGFDFDPSSKAATRFVLRVFPIDKLNSLDGSSSSNIISRFFSKKESAPWNCSDIDKNATICKSVATTSSEENGYIVSKSADGSTIILTCSINQDSPLFKKKNDCFTQ